jgi:hypothetical protein
MTNAFRSLDRILRGEATQLPLLQRGQFDIPIGGLTFVVILLGVLYGACMGLPALITRWNADRMQGVDQVLASMAKVPLLFLLTLFITFPSLYVFNALVGSRLTMGALLKLLIAAVAVMLALLAAFGPIVAFFAASTDSYPFMKLLNVIVFTIAGVMGLKFLLQTLHRLTIVQLNTPPAPPPASAEASAEGSPPGALEPMADRTPANVTTVFRIWVVVFGLVGAQMGWVLRPFIGDPKLPFSFFRPRESNFFEGLGHTLQRLFGV